MKSPPPSSCSTSSCSAPRSYPSCQRTCCRTNEAPSPRRRSNLRLPLSESRQKGMGAFAVPLSASCLLRSRRARTSTSIRGLTDGRTDGRTSCVPRTDTSPARSSFVTFVCPVKEKVRFVDSEERSRDAPFHRSIFASASALISDLVDHYRI